MEKELRQAVVPVKRCIQNPLNEMARFFKPLAEIPFRYTLKLL
jgi:hypothetical protein